jgi:hypothetical protein
MTSLETAVSGRASAACARPATGDAAKTPTGCGNTGSPRQRSIDCGRPKTIGVPSAGTPGRSTWTTTMTPDGCGRCYVSGATSDSAIIATIPACSGPRRITSSTTAALRNCERSPPTRATGGPAGHNSFPSAVLGWPGGEPCRGRADRRDHVGDVLRQRLVSADARGVGAPVGSQPRPPDLRPTPSCSRGRALLAAGEVDGD